MKQEKTQIKSSPSQPSTLSTVVFWIVSIGTALFVCVGFFYWTIVPFLQSTTYLADTQQAFGSGDFSIFSTDQFIFDPDSNVEGILRSDFVRQVLTQYSNGNLKGDTPVLEKSISEMEEYMSHHKNYYTYIVGLANAYSVKAGITNDPQDIAMEDKYFQQALATIPGRQDVAYSYAISLAKQNRQDEAFALLQSMIVKNPDIYATYAQIGELKMMEGETHYTEALNQYEIALNHDVDPNPDFTKSVYQELVRYYYQQNDIVNFTTAITRLLTLDPDQKTAYTSILDYMKINNKIPRLNIGPAAGK